MRKLNFNCGSGVMCEDKELALFCIMSGDPFRIVREKGITSKFYSFNHQIVRLDFSNRCSILENVKIC